MDKAFDVLFQSEVDAMAVARTSSHTYGERFRYQCICCGEEVYLAAADSTIKSPHFRHRRGNNETDCERYLGQQGALEHYLSIRKHSKEHIGFYFNIEQKVFEISLTLSSEEIDKTHADGGKLSLYVKYYTQAFFTMPINNMNMVPNINNYYMLDEYANDYYVSYDNSGTKTKYSDVIRRNFKLNIYRVNQTNNHYKKNTSYNLYTNCRYLAVSENKTNITELVNLHSVEIDDDIISFITQGREFFAVEFVINCDDYGTKIFFLKHDLSVERSESMDILWPPVYIRDNTLVSNSEKLYISPTFELIPHGNINSHVMDVRNVCENVFELYFNDKVSIVEKNVECRIIKEERELSDLCFEEAEYVYANRYTIPELYDYFLFDKNGCTQLIAGANIYLSDTDRILGYKNGHVKVIILAEEKKEFDKKILIQDIIKYHPQVETFEPDEFMDIVTDEIVLTYLESCYRSGYINTVVKKYIKEGLI